MARQGLHLPDYNFSLFEAGWAGRAHAEDPRSASIALGVAALQVLLALWIYRKVPLAAAHARAWCGWPCRIVGFALFALTVPIALHCLIAYGVQLTSVRVAGALPGRSCFFYGVGFVAKVLLVQSQRLPGWALPVAGGALGPVVSGVLWYTVRALVLQRLPAPWHVARTRAYFTEDTPAAEVTDRFGCSTASVHQMATPALHTGKMSLFTGAAAEARRGPLQGDHRGLRQKVLALRLHKGDWVTGIALCSHQSAAASAQTV